MKQVKQDYTPKPIKVRNVRDARRLLSRLISQLQAGEIKSQEAKDLTYLLISYVNIYKETELEARIEQLEKLKKPERNY